MSNAQDSLSHPVPVLVDDDIDSKQYRAACAVARMWQREATDIVQRDDDRFDVLMPEPIRWIRVCAFERGHDLVVGADDGARCFVLVWETGDASVYDVRGVVASKRLKKRSVRKGERLIFPEQSLSRPDALKLDYERFVTLDVPLR